MTFETLVLGLIAGYCIWLLYRSFRKDQAPFADKIRVISPQTGEVMEMHVLRGRPVPQTSTWDEGAFLMGAKWIFERISRAFAACDLKTLQLSLSPEVYHVFEREITGRQDRHQHMDFSLICFDSAEVIHKNKAVDEVTVRFQTEQINLLKDEKGNVIEGDKMSVATMTDTWVFKKVKNNEWIIAATQSRMTPCTK